jgi:hypothetical protein
MRKHRNQIGGGTMSAGENVSTENERLMTRKELAQHLTAQGIRTPKSKLDKLSMPSRGVYEGPPVEGRWGNVDLYRPSRGLAWARERMSRGAR